MSWHWWFCHIPYVLQMAVILNLLQLVLFGNFSSISNLVPLCISMAYMSALPYAYNNPLPSPYPPSPVNFISKTHLLRFMPDGLYPSLPTGPSTSMGPPPILVNCWNTSRSGSCPSHNQHTNTLSSWMFTKRAKQSTGVKKILTTSLSIIKNHQMTVRLCIQFSLDQLNYCWTLFMLLCWLTHV
jgi:hypothetical protein